MDVLPLLGLERPRSAVAPIRHPDVALGGGRPAIGLSPVSRWETKNWPASHFAAFAREMVRRRGASLYVLGGPGDAAVGEVIAAEAGPGVTNLCGRHRLPELFGVLADLDLLVANDTGPVHMAAALGKPCLVLFGPTRPEWTGPYGEGHRVLVADVPCRPCMSRHCRVGNLPCLAGIPPLTVIETACEMLDRGGS